MNYKFIKQIGFCSVFILFIGCLKKEQPKTTVQGVVKNKLAGVPVKDIHSSIITT